MYLLRIARISQDLPYLMNELHARTIEPKSQNQSVPKTDPYG